MFTIPLKGKVSAAVFTVCVICGCVKCFKPHNNDKQIIILCCLNIYNFFLHVYIQSVFLSLVISVSFLPSVPSGLLASFLPPFRTLPTTMQEMAMTCMTKYMDVQ